jgi:hypothetical protein
MSKHRLSPDGELLPSSKRIHSSQKHISNPKATFDGSLYDELILHIFAFLPAQSLCHIQPTNRTWCRLAVDNQVHIKCIGTYALGAC